MLDQQDLPVEQEVVEVHGVHAVLALGVAARHPQDVVDQRGELRAPVEEHVGERRLGVDRHGDEVDEDVGLGEAARPHREPAVGDGGGHHVAAVLAVEDGVALLVAEQPRRARAGPGGRRGGRCRPRCRRVSTRATSSTRRSISRAALLVKVRSSSDSGSRWPWRSRATRQVSVRVLPEPAPAMTRSGPSGASITARCSSLSWPPESNGAGRAGGRSQLVAARHRAPERSTAVRQIRYRAPARELDGRARADSMTGMAASRAFLLLALAIGNVACASGKASATRRPLPPPAGDGRAGDRGARGAGPALASGPLPHPS